MKKQAKQKNKTSKEKKLAKEQEHQSEKISELLAEISKLTVKIQGLEKELLDEINNHNELKAKIMHLIIDSSEAKK